MSLELRAELLKAAMSKDSGVRELARELHRRTDTVVSLIKEMEEQNLLKRETRKPNARGRPRILVKPTTLGEDYLAAYTKLDLKILRSKRADLVQAARDGEYASRLESRGLAVFDLFLELNSIVGHNREGVA